LILTQWDFTGFTYQVLTGRKSAVAAENIVGAE